jgi:hypothetical protein
VGPPSRSVQAGHKSSLDRINRYREDAMPPRAPVEKTFPPARARVTVSHTRAGVAGMSM